MHKPMWFAGLEPPDVVFLWAIVVEGETERDGKARFFVVSV